MIPNQLKNQHLLWRAGFGPRAKDFDKLSANSQHSYATSLFNASAEIPPYLDVAAKEIKELMMGVREPGRKLKKVLSVQEKKQLRIASKVALHDLNLTWMKGMVNSEQQLREKMSLFWHGHFASRNINILYQQQLLGVIRNHALGNFGQLLQEVSKTAAILNFLNNNQNRKGHPNENFAREVMELFTIGRGHYTETDVKEAARAFTGWGASIKGEFIIRENQHDDGNKSFFGKSGNFNGDDILQILLDQKQTATYITRKIYKYFVNEEADEELVKILAEKFYNSGYNISELMKTIFTSDWFYEPRNIGSKIKSPIELLVGIQRVLPIHFENEEVLILLQRLLGQLLFYPPNVAGWPGGRSWIDSSSLMLRLKIPGMLGANGELTTKPKDDDDQMMGMEENKKMKAFGKGGGQLLKAAINWSKYQDNFSKIPREKLTATLSSLLLQIPKSLNTELLNGYSDLSDRENFVRTTTIRLMSTPEYQMC